MDLRSVCHTSPAEAKIALFRGRVDVSPPFREPQDGSIRLLALATGVLAATTAFGKTVIAAWLIAQRRTNALVVLHRRQLLDQWIERLSTFLDLPVKSIGRIGGGRSDRQASSTSP
jgi:superfamily II DNA or RNA helicase